MSITYSLYLGSDRRPSEVLDQLEAALGSPGAVTEHLDLSATEVKAPADWFIHDDFGVTPRVRMTMRLHKEDLAKSQDTVVDVLTLMIGQSTGDLLLLREDESIAYKRHEGHSEVGATDPLWADAGRRAKIDKAQRRRRITLG